MTLCTGPDLWVVVEGVGLWPLGRDVLPTGDAAGLEFRASGFAGFPLAVNTGRTEGEDILRVTCAFVGEALCSGPRDEPRSGSAAGATVRPFAIWPWTFTGA